ncbi:hypothetical protein [Shewanella sp. HN-41]|uniref:hypothetical protein n=1 Tax=Shewanella sp. HN-41 TaxID=327275 RepID=UPI0002125DA7|nr:hypothetical protein [Shewanella sp. HN-41]EGM71175.1 hypothetical protein SOHN41_00909 [Shewanella sp. HN-41]
MKTLTYLQIASSLLVCSLIPLSHATAASPSMEIITVTYRSPLDYALYQHTTEILSEFRIEIREDISIQARNGLQEMAKAQRVNRIEVAHVTGKDKNLASMWLSQTAKANK